VIHVGFLQNTLFLNLVKHTHVVPHVMYHVYFCFMVVFVWVTLITVNGMEIKKKLKRNVTFIQNRVLHFFGRDTV